MLVFVGTWNIDEARQLEATIMNSYVFKVLVEIIVGRFAETDLFFFWRTKHYMADKVYNFCAVYYPRAVAKVRLPLGLPAGWPISWGSQPVFNCHPRTSDTCYFNHVQAMMSFHSIPLRNHNGKT